MTAQNRTRATADSKEEFERQETISRTGNNEADAEAKLQTMLKQFYPGHEALRRLREQCPTDRVTAILELCHAVQVSLLCRDRLENDTRQ